MSTQTERDKRYQRTITKLHNELLQVRKSRDFHRDKWYGAEHMLRRAEKDYKLLQDQLAEARKVRRPIRFGEAYKLVRQDGGGWFMAMFMASLWVCSNTEVEVSDAQ